MPLAMLHQVDGSQSRIACEHLQPGALFNAGAAAKAAVQCLEDTGAIRHCPLCGDTFLVAKNEQAERQAFDRAEHLWKAGLRGFDGMTEGSVAAAVRSALDGTPATCPSCG